MLVNVVRGGITAAAFLGSATLVFAGDRAPSADQAGLGMDQSLQARRQIVARADNWRAPTSPAVPGSVRGSSGQLRALPPSEQLQGSPVLKNRAGQLVPVSTLLDSPKPLKSVREVLHASTPATQASAPLKVLQPSARRASPAIAIDRPLVNELKPAAATVYQSPVVEEYQTVRSVDPSFAADEQTSLQTWSEDRQAQQSYARQDAQVRVSGSARVVYEDDDDVRREVRYVEYRPAPITTYTYVSRPALAWGVSYHSGWGHGHYRPHHYSHHHWHRPVWHRPVYHCPPPVVYYPPPCHPRSGFSINVRF